MQLDRSLATVTPTADGDVLAALAMVDRRMTITQIGLVVGRYSDEGIRKVLARLVAQGIVHSERAGRTSAFWLNRDHLAADGIAEISRAKERLLDRLRDSLREWPLSIAYAAIFGSAAQGAMRPESDIDLIVVHDDDASELILQERTVDLMLRVWRWTGNALSVLSMSVTELGERRDERLLHEIRADAITVAGSRNWFEAQFRGRDGDHADA